MRRIAIVIVMLGMFATVSLAGAPPARAQAAGPAEMEREFVALLNDLRASKGLPALAPHDELVAKARRWSATMAAADDIWHSDLPEGITAPWRRLGENVGMGGSVRALHDAFVASPHHYENLVDAGFNHIGIGVVVDGDGTIFVSQEFMQLEPNPTPPAPSTNAPETGAAASPKGPGAIVSSGASKPAAAPTRTESDKGGPAPAAPSRGEAQANGWQDDVAGPTASGERARSARMQTIAVTTQAQFLALVAVFLLAGTSTGLGRVAARRVIRAAQAR